MIAGVLLDVASRCSVLAFASAHVLGLLTGHPVPWSATLTAGALLVVAIAATVRAGTGTLRGVALAAGLTAVTGLVAEVEYRGGGLGWPFFLTGTPAAGAPALVEAGLLTSAVLTLSAAAVLPAHDTGHRLRDRIRAWRADRRTGVLDLTTSPPAPGAAPGMIDLDLPPAATPAAAGIVDLGTPGSHGAARLDAAGRPRRAPGWWRARLAVAGTVAAAGLAVAVATRPLWTRDGFGQLPLTASRDGAGLLLAVVPALLAVVAGTVAAGWSLRRARGGTALAALVLVALTVPVVWARGGEHRFSPAPPAAQVLRVATLTEGVYRPPAGWLPPPLVHPSAPPATVGAGPAHAVRRNAGTDARASAADGVLAGVALIAFLALIAALLRRPGPGGSPR
jgi:hypothetical protein